MERGPYLNTAVFCETAIEGRDGTLSIIKIVDTVIQTAAGPDPPAKMPAFVARLNVVIVLRAGEARGRYTILLRPEAPDGRKLPAHEQAVQFVGDTNAYQLIGQIELPVELEGIYWFDVVFVAGPENEELLTRIPLRAVYQPQKTAPS
jgi:hypothetical protein